MNEAPYGTVLAVDLGASRLRAALVGPDRCLHHRTFIPQAIGDEANSTIGGPLS